MTLSSYRIDRISLNEWTKIDIDLMVDTSNEPRQLRMTTGPHAALKSADKPRSVSIPITSIEEVAKAVQMALNMAMELSEEKKQKSSSVNAAGRPSKRRR